MPRVKVCGITLMEDALLCEALGADALGFIFYKKSKRYITPEKASSIINSLSPFTMKVGVFVNEPPEMINEIAFNLKLNAVQLHGDETPADAEKIFLPVIKSFRISGSFDFTVLNNYKNVFYLLDAFKHDEYGGTGSSFNWESIPEILRNKIILAGGVSEDNLEIIFKNIKPAAIDLSSSLEIEPGKKDKEKVKRFFNKLNSLKENIC